MARATGSASKVARSDLEPPPRTSTSTSQSAVCRAPSARAMARRGVAPLDRAGHHPDIEGQAGVLEPTEEVPVALGAGTGHQADPEGQGGDGETTVPVEETFVEEGLEEPGPLGGHLAQEGVGVELGEDEVHRPAGLVELDVPPDPDHHAGVELDAQLVEGRTDPAPLTGPALDVEGGRGAVVGVGGIDQVDEAVALGEDLQRADLPRDPQIAGEGGPEGAVHPAVELGDRQGGTVHGGEVGDPGGGHRVRLTGWCHAPGGARRAGSRTPGTGR